MRLTIDLDAPGKREGYALVPHSTNISAYGSVPIPIGVIGGGAGQTILIMGGVHGDEYEAQIAIRTLFRQIDPGQVQGRIIFVPSLNDPACRAGARVSPIDDQNLNRVFPGSASGTVTEKIARFVHDELAPIADVWLDFHSGGRSLMYEPMIAMHKSADSSRNEKAKELMTAFGGELALIWNDFPEPSMAKGTAEEHGCVYLGSEFGGGGTVSAAGYQLCVSGTLRLLRKAGVLLDDGEMHSPITQKTLTVEGVEGHAFAYRKGVFNPLVALGEHVEAGQTIGEIVSIDGVGEAPSPIVAPKSGRVVCLRHMANTDIGDAVMHVGVPYS